MKAFLVCALLGAAALRSSPAPPFCTLAEVKRSTTPSHACLPCHDGTVATSRHSGHIGAAYFEKAASGAYSLRASGPVAPVLLVEGRVECTSCHDGRSAERHALALPMARSALCTACHER